jgi:hypothetical protein
VVRLGGYSDPPFAQAVNTPVLRDAFDKIVGRGRWLPRASSGTFPIRFPSPQDPGDAGWHVDASFGTDTDDFMSWRINIHSKGRALLMLFLFSDVGDEDAPTRIRIGSLTPKSFRFHKHHDFGPYHTASIYPSATTCPTPRRAAKNHSTSEHNDLRNGASWRVSKTLLSNSALRCLGFG